MNVVSECPHASTLSELRESGWVSKSVKQEMQDNFVRMLESGEPLFPGIVGYEDTVIPEINLALLAGHDMLFLGEKGQAKSRIMRMLTRFLDEWVPYIDHPDLPVHEDPRETHLRGWQTFVPRHAGRPDPHRLVAS
ncbi:magnesium protoporphyrin chelatase [Rhodopirellula maiorica SM1]|uniref:Magnesium protoporphyrin chelatase n=1 Tax=Rhodopirellula maiorica SM1 TaxID=1265738 RepID=M5RF79_9BACT|nr:magnesium protoporphyrin chelatase [Rhodopirellula maiorica SM1]